MVLEFDDERKEAKRLYKLLKARILKYGDLSEWQRELVDKYYRRR
jgi:hypothetical protein